jgi:hypothetical protein
LKKLVSSNEAAQLLGLSLQGIHYRIKKGQLESIKKEGKIFVYVDSNVSKPQQIMQTNAHQNDYKLLEDKIIQSKDEQINLLKRTIKFMKKQYKSEIHRLDKNQTQILSVFQSEVDLLKSAFNEMRNLYKIDHKEHTEESKPKKVVQPADVAVEMEFMNIKEFFVFMRNHEKSDAQIKSIILNKVQHGDKRFIYNKNTKEILIYKSDFFDII